MKSDQRGRLWTLLVVFAFCPIALAQSALVADADNSTASMSFTARQETLILFDPGADGKESAPAQPAETSEPHYGWRIGVYPVLAWAPVFGASYTLPPAPSNPSETPSGSTDSALNGAYFGGARFEPGKWSADFLFMWAALHAERKTPFAKVNLDFVFGDAMVGRDVFRGFYVEGGFRRLALSIDAADESERVKRTPGYWDPLIGLTYRRELGKKWRIMLHGDGGGFGVGSDVDVTGTGRAEWQFARHFGLSMGYGGMHFSVVDTAEGESVAMSPTLHGPIFGFGLFY